MVAMIRDNHGSTVPRSLWDIGDYEEAVDWYEERVTELEAQVRWLRDYAISKACEVRQLKFGEIPTEHEIRFIIGGIDGNIAVAGDRAKAAIDD